MFYFCHECKKIVDDLKDYYLLDEKAPRPFCSKECIVNYYDEIIFYFEEREKKLRKKLSLENENIEEKNIQSLSHKCLESPGEKWLIENEIGERFFVLISKTDDLFCLSICFLLNEKPSFVILQILTRSNELVEEFRLGKKMVTDVGVEEAQERSIRPATEDQYYEITEDILSYLEQKKNELWEDLMTKLRQDDISPNTFDNYVHCLEETLFNPDEAYQGQDGDYENITYVKFCSDSESKLTFYYILICLEFFCQKDKEKRIIPILGFPTTSQVIYKEFVGGEKIKGPTVN